VRSATAHRATQDPTGQETGRQTEDQEGDAGHTRDNVPDDARSRRREPDRKRRALALAALNIDRSAVRLDDPARDREPEAGPALLARARRIDAEEAIEQVRDRRGRDADSGVRDAQASASPERMGWPSGD